MPVPFWVNHRQPLIMANMNSLTFFCLLLFATASSPFLANSAIAADAPATPAKQSTPKPAETPKRITQLPDGRVFLTARDATIHGKKLRYEHEKNTLGYWFNADDWVSWDFEITRPGKLIVDLDQSCGADSGGSHYTVEVGEQKLKDKVQETGTFRQFRLRRLGTLQFDKPGVYTLSVRPHDKPHLAVMDLRAVTLTPPDFDKRPAAGALKKPTAPSAEAKK